MPHDEERILGDRLAEEMERPPNIGWRCNVVDCPGYVSLIMPGAANNVLAHIKADHPLAFLNGTWSMLAVRPEKKGVETSEYVYVCKRCKIKVIGCRARPCCYCESGLCSECFEKAEYQRKEAHRGDWDGAVLDV